MIIKLLPDNKLLDGDAAAAPLTRLLQEAAVPVSTPCGSRGKCGKCRVHFTGGAVPEPTPEETAILSPEEIARGDRLACMTRVRADAALLA